MPAASDLQHRPRAQPPRIPELSAAVKRTQAERGAYLAAREALERRSMLRGLILLAVLAVVVSLWRAGWDRAFIPGWWKQW